jgi:hypothetical protein
MTSYHRRQNPSLPLSGIVFFSHLCRIQSYHRGGFEEFCLLGSSEGLHGVISQKIELFKRSFTSK